MRNIKLTKINPCSAADRKSFDNVKWKTDIDLYLLTKILHKTVINIGVTFIALRVMKRQLNIVKWGSNG